MVNEKLPAPYPHLAWISKLFDILGKIKLDKIDSKTIAAYGITSPRNESKIVSTLKFLKIIDEEGKVNKESYIAFSYSGEKRQEELSRLVREAYKELFETIPSLENVDFDVVKNFFISHYGYTGNLAEAAAKAFSYVGRESGIKLSEDILNKIDIRERTSKKSLKSGKEGKNSNKKSLKKTHEDLLTLSGVSSSISLQIKNSPSMIFHIEDLAEWNSAKIFIDMKMKKLFGNQDNQGLNASSSGTDEDSPSL